MPVDWARIDVIKLGYLARLPHMLTYMEMVAVLCERWHSEIGTFHLPTSEMTVTLEDVYRVFRLPIQGTLMMVVRGGIEQRVVKRLVGPRVQFRI